MKTITYFYRGQIERGNGEPGYDWHNGYSPNSDDGNVTAPWMTKRECQAEARKQGCQAVFETNQPKGQTE